MVKKIGIILLFVVAVGARHAVPLQGLPLLSDTAFAQLQENGQPCPPECVIDSMEIITYYPSPYGYYEELRGDKIIVGDTDNSHIDETHLPPSGTITFEPKSYAEITNTGTSYEGAIYYDSFDHEFKYYDKNNSWQPLVGGGAGGATGVKNCDFIGTDADGNLICSRSSLYGKVHDTSQCEGSGGEVYEETNGVKHCKFTASVCPSGWIHYPNWTATQNTSCSSCTGCTTSNHIYQNTANIEACSFSTPNCGGHECTACWARNTGVCYAQIIKIGCY